jgi:hypothetical protein
VRREDAGTRRQLPRVGESRARTALQVATREQADSRTQDDPELIKYLINHPHRPTSWMSSNVINVANIANVASAFFSYFCCPYNYAKVTGNGGPYKSICHRNSASAIISTDEDEEVAVLFFSLEQ